MSRKYENVTLHMIGFFEALCHHRPARLHDPLNCCNSIEVETGCWMIYECPNYTGHQYFLRKGEYPDYQHWMCFNDSIRSCINHHSNSRASRKFDSTNIVTKVLLVLPQEHSWLQIYEWNDFGGRMLEFMDNCPSLQDDFHYRDIQFCNILEGSWVFYEQPHFRGQQYLLRPGEYRQLTNWGAMTAKVGSFQPTVHIS
ncbi:gamma-crystallin 1-like [Ciconia maguari]